MLNRTIEELIETARELNEKNEFRQVIDLIPLKTVKEHPNADLADELAKAFAARANALIEERDYERSINDLNRAIKLVPNNSEYHFVRAWLVGLSDHVGAIKGFTKAMELNAREEKYFFYRGMVYNSEKMYTEAIADFDQAIALNPDHADAYIARAHSWYSKKEYDRSISDLTMSIGINPNISTAWHNRGSAWYDKKEYDKGIADLSEAISLNPGFASSYFERGLNYEANKQYEEAVADYSKAIGLDSLWISPWFHRAGIWKEKKEYEKALDDYDEIIGMSRKYRGAHCNRGIVLYELEKYHEAFIDFKRAQELAPDDNDAKKWVKKADAKLREAADLYDYMQTVREHTASFIEQIVKDYGKKFKGHNDGFVHGERIRKWDPVKQCPARTGITGWLPAFRPDLATWDKHEKSYFSEMDVYTKNGTMFTPREAGISISKKLWKAITGEGHLYIYDEEDIGFVRKFENVAPMLKRIATRIRTGNLDEDIFFEDDEEAEDDL